MSRIDELIAELAPKGVEFKPVGEVTARSSNIKWANAGDDEFQYIDLSSVDRVTRRIGETASITAGNAPSRAQQIVHTGDVIFATTRPAQMRWAVIPPEYDGQIASTGYCVLRPDTSVVLTNFLAHILGADAFRQYVEANQVAGNYPSISDNRVRAYRIPVPPLEVQREIVRVLDQFTQLEAELEAELEARRQQYEHYRMEALTFEPDTEWVKLSDVVDYTNGKAHEKLADPEGEAAMVTARFISRNGEANRFVRVEDIQTPAVVGDVAMVLSDLPNGRALARTFYVDREDAYAINQRVARLRVIDPSKTSSRFVNHYLNRNPDLLRHDNGVDQTHLSKAQVTGLRFPSLTLREQQQIADILDKFDTLVNDLSIGLPAELKARRKQYEYYRDRLLTFEEAAA